jgi:hypothetical protein
MTVKTFRRNVFTSGIYSNTNLKKECDTWIVKTMTITGFHNPKFKICLGKFAGTETDPSNFPQNPKWYNLKLFNGSDRVDKEHQHDNIY